MGVLADLAATFSKWRIWHIMAEQDIRLRYRRSFLGPFWVSISLVTLVLGLALLYSQILNQPFLDYLAYLAFGFLAWNQISALVLESCNSIIESESHVRATQLPSTVLAARTAYRNLIIFSHNFVAVVILMAFFGVYPNWDMPLGIVGALLNTLVGFLLSVTMAPLCARFRDIPQIVTNIMGIGFFLTPVIWRPEAVSNRFLWVDANPFYHMIEIVRRPMMGELPATESWLVCGSIVLTLSVIAFAVTAITRKRIFLWV